MEKIFDPKAKKLTNVPIWVDLPSLPLHFFRLIKNIRAQLGTKVLGQKHIPSINPKWESQILVEINTIAPIK